ncbi:PAS domain-containing hybrid sensor histidine kinase/response regulator [Pelagicoccus mobilis]|uniref:histidine kinase n=1 Tax=Pelagicoccus mobilis TaxID=415221 RepID=A0A934RZJ3_9BACT|nr:ATP-binding protein [Pelagicoccus mobilis]MBK1878204.1 PAS domain S-box protein [Pelagicoccus mobilis]
MTELNRTQLCWSLAALLVTSLVGLLGYELVVKRVIVASETDRLKLWMANPQVSEVDGFEVYKVLADGSLASDETIAIDGLSPEDTLELVFDGKGELGVFRGGWIYVSQVGSWGGEAVSGWNLARSDAGARLEKASLAIGVLTLGFWAGFVLLFYFFHRRVRRILFDDLSHLRERLGLEKDEADRGLRERLSHFSEQIVAAREQEGLLMHEMGRFTAIALNAPDGIFICDSEGRIEWANAAFERMIGYSLEEIQEREPFAHLRNELNDPLYLARLGRALEQEDSVSLELGGWRPDTSEYWTSMQLSPLPTSGEQKKWFFGIQSDITEKRRASLDLEEVSRRFALAMESASVGIWDWDVKRDELVWDDHTYGLYGVSRANFRPSYRSWMNCIDPDDTNRVVRSIDDSLARGKSIELVACVQRPDGKEAYVRSVGRAFLNESGEVMRYIGITSDVTAEHKAERNLIDQKDEAETLAEQLAVAVKKSKKAATEAERATRAKSAFLAMMSHEIRTPMNGVIGMASLLLETELDEHQRDYLNTIRVSGDTLLTLINDILDYSKIESGKLDIEHVPFSIRECVEDAVDLLSSKAAEKGIDLLCRVDLTTPKEVEGDITRLRQILVNLIGNAIKFTEVGEVEVSVSAPENGRIHFAVRDTGIGIPEDRMNRLFEVFSQVDSSTTRKYGGSGLGLSISKQLTNLMGGEMWVESSLGKGSVFHFDIAFDHLEQALPDPIFGEQTELVGRKLLLLVPSAVRRESLRRLYVRWGLEVDFQGSVESMSAKPRDSGKYDFVVVDEGAWDADGGDNKRILNTCSGSDSTAVMLLNHGSNPERFGRSQCVFKPCRVGAMLDALLASKRLLRVKGKHSGSKERVGDEKLASRMPLRILVADDNSVNQKVARMMLKKFGYTPDLVANGLEAVEAVKKRDYDLVFMDCQMPEMDGFEATCVIRQIELERSSSRRSFIYALTANVRGESREMSVEAGMDGFLAKPIKLDDIKASLLEVSEEIASRN